MSADVTNNNRGKKRGYASSAILYVLFAIGAVTAVNLISTRVFGRLDLTENKTYTLSKPSKDLVRTLPDFLTLKLFVSPDLPPQLSSLGRYVRDLVDEYKAASNGKLRWEAIEPTPGSDKEKNKKLEEEANRCKVQKVQIQAVHGQKFEVGEYYLGLCLVYGTQMESIPQVAGAEGLEYEISSLIKRMTQRKRKVAFTTGHGESDTNQGFQALKQALERNYDVTTVNPSSAEIGKDIDALVIGGPKQALDEKALREIDKFLMTGKGAVVLADGMAMSSPGGAGMHGMEQMQIKMAQANETGLGKLLEPYGFKIDPDFVFDDKQAMPGLLEVGGRKMLVNAPFFVAAETEKAPELSVLEGIRGLVFPFGSSVTLAGPLASGKPAAGKLWRVASSSKDGYKHTGFFVLGGDPRQLKLDPPKERGSYAFGYAYQGPLRSAFAPPPVANESSAPTPGTESAKPVRLVVMGDSDFANDEYVQLARMFQVYQAGAELLFNAIGWTVEDEALTPLRSKTLSPRPIKLSSEQAGVALQVGNMLGVPAAFCLFGVVLWRVRRSRRTGQKL
jgi:gliding-associated putative ABC transporter substrate-binding component GldG